VNDARLGEIPPHERQQGTFDSTRAFLVGESQRQPVVVVIDDVQWMDATSDALLDHLAVSAAAHRLLIIACSRLEHAPTWSRRPTVLPVVLGPLDSAERQRLIDGSLDATALGPELLALAEERSEGNPFFLEELLKGLAEADPARRAAGDAMLIPPTVEDLITARIDRLEEPVKRVFQIAAVIGREFDFDLLRDVVGVDEELRPHVTRLVELDLVREQAIFPVWKFAFKSSLAHEVVYRTLLAGRRRDLHGRVARAIEHRAEKYLEETYELIAYHLSRSGDAEAAVRYLLLAGGKAVRHFALADAGRYFDEAADKLRRLPADVVPRYVDELAVHRERLVRAQGDADAN